MKRKTKLCRYNLLKAIKLNKAKFSKNANSVSFNLMPNVTLKVCA